MKYIYKYCTPEEYSDMYMSSDCQYLTGLWFEHSADSAKNGQDVIWKELPIFADTTIWLNDYFNGHRPENSINYKINNLTEFRREVDEIMLSIDYGQILTYGDIAQKIAEKRGIERMSAQAVGNAVGANPVCIIIPCHRVVGTKGNLAGYGGGLKNKIALLKHEGLDMSRFYIPVKGNKL